MKKFETTDRLEVAEICVKVGKKKKKIVYWYCLQLKVLISINVYAIYVTSFILHRKPSAY